MDKKVFTADLRCRRFGQNSISIDHILKNLFHKLNHSQKIVMKLINMDLLLMSKEIFIQTPETLSCFFSNDYIEG